MCLEVDLQYAIAKTCVCTRTNHNCDETTLRLGVFIWDFISNRDEVPYEDNLKHVKIIIDFLCTE